MAWWLHIFPCLFSTRNAFHERVSWRTQMWLFSTDSRNFNCKQHSLCIIWYIDQWDYQSRIKDILRLANISSIIRDWRICWRTRYHQRNSQWWWFENTIGWGESQYFLQWSAYYSPSILLLFAILHQIVLSFSLLRPLLLSPRTYRVWSSGQKTHFFIILPITGACYLFQNIFFWQFRSQHSIAHRGHILDTIFLDLLILHLKSLSLSSLFLE